MATAPKAKKKSLLEGVAATADSSENTAQAFYFSEPDDQIEGTVTSLGSYDGGYGEYPIVVVETDDGEEWAIHGLGTVLKDKLKKAEVGDSIGVRFDGERPTKGGRTFKAYTVVIVKP